MLEFWKVKRELKRLTMQTVIPFDFLTMRLRRWHYDATNKGEKNHSYGKQPLKNNIAIVLLFQPKGVKSSIFETLKHFIEKGFTPIVVSNTLLGEKDKEKLLAYSYLVLERPNFGYDFGGYRDGILYLLERELHPENLILTNDSIWFPVQKNCDFIDTVLQQKADLFGIVMSDRPEAPHRNHLQPYFYNFKRPLVSDKCFHKFWQNLYFSSNKFLVVRKCEMVLTEYFSQNGFSVGWLLDFQNLKDALKLLSRTELKTVATYQVEVDRKNSEEVSHFLKSELDKPDWKTRVEALIERKQMGKYILIAHPSLLLDKLSLPILKRDQQPIYQHQRRAIFSEGLESRLTESVLQEISCETKITTKSTDH